MPPRFFQESKKKKSVFTSEERNINKNINIFFSSYLYAYIEVYFQYYRSQYQVEQLCDTEVGIKGVKNINIFMYEFFSMIKESHFNQI